MDTTKTPEVIDQDRRRLLGTATIAAAGAVNLFPSQLVAAATSDAIRPFRVDVPEERLVDLRRRLAATQWPEKETVADETQGVQLATIQQLVRYWQTSHDWRKVEARLNALPQFITEIDGLDIHFIHVRSKHDNALPMIVTHGWPGSIIEQMKIIDPLTESHRAWRERIGRLPPRDPVAAGLRLLREADGARMEPGQHRQGVGDAHATPRLHQVRGTGRRLGECGLGGDGPAGAAGIAGIHTNMAATVPANISRALAFHEAPPADLTAEERNAWNQLDFFYKKGLGYALEMSNRPQTLYGLVDSPAGLAAWMIDHDDSSEKMIARVFAGQSEGLTRDDVLDNVTLYWLTNTAISSARLYWDTTQISNGAGFFDVRGVKIPVAVSAFADEIYQAPRSWAERAYPKLIHYNKLPKGGHFAAWEQPELFTAEMRAAFRSLRQPT